MLPTDTLLPTTVVWTVLCSTTVLWYAHSNGQWPLPPPKPTSTSYPGQKEKKAFRSQPTLHNGARARANSDPNMPACPPVWLGAVGSGCRATWVDFFSGLYHLSIRIHLSVSGLQIKSPCAAALLLQHRLLLLLPAPSQILQSAQFLCLLSCLLFPHFDDRFPPLVIHVACWALSESNKNKKRKGEKGPGNGGSRTKYHIISTTGAPSLSLSQRLQSLGLSSSVPRSTPFFIPSAARHLSGPTLGLGDLGSWTLDLGP